MKATGIVRRIDELGRIVIPKEIRRTLRIREGDPLEIFTGRDGEVVLKKYSPIGELSEYATLYAAAMSDTIGQSIYITDLDQVIVAEGSGRKEAINKSLTVEFEELVKQRKQVLVKKEEKEYLDIWENMSNEAYAILITPIVCDGDIIGSIVILQRDQKKELGELEKQLANVGAHYLGGQMEQ